MVVHEITHIVYEEIAIFITIATIGGLIGFFTNVRRCLEKQSARTLRLMKAMQLLANEIDKQTNRDHKNADSTLRLDISKILKDEKGNL